MEREFQFHLEKRIVTKQKGYTLIELLFVLQVVIFGSYLILPQNRLEITPHTLILQEIELTIEQARLDAISQNSKQSITFEHHSVYYEDYSISFEQLQFDNKQVITFNHLGHIQQAKTIDFSIQSKNYQLIFNLGQGVYHIEEV